MSSSLKTVSKTRLWVVFITLLAGLACSMFGLFAAGIFQYLCFVGLGLVILAIILQAALIQCPYCGHRSLTSFTNPTKRTGQCSSCGKKFKIQ